MALSLALIGSTKGFFAERERDRPAAAAQFVFGSALLQRFTIGEIGARLGSNNAGGGTAGYPVGKNKGGNFLLKFVLRHV